MTQMNNLFDKVIVSTDIHFGLKSNSSIHNQDCIDFFNWKIEIAKSKNINTCFILGDLHHHRNNVNAITQDYILRALALLNDNFESIYILIGNHDIYWKDSRDISIIKFAQLFPNVVLINTPQIIGNVGFVPWMVGDEWKQIQNMKCKYLFGHLEIPGFRINANIDMPDHGLLNENHLAHPDYVFSGHFHKRQNKNNIHYIGNPFGHNYADAWDFDRGLMILEWDKKPQYINYEDGPRYLSLTLTDFVKNMEKYVKPKSHIQIELDSSMTYEDASILKDELLNTYKLREVKLVENDIDLSQNSSIDIKDLKSVDEIVLSELTVLESSEYDTTTLINIYNNL